MNQPSLFDAALAVKQRREAVSRIGPWHPALPKAPVIAPALPKKEFVYSAIRQSPPLTKTATVKAAQKKVSIEGLNAIALSRPENTNLSATQLKSMKTLGLSSVREALLCVPTAYVDCRHPLTNSSECSDGEKTLLLLRRTGKVEPLDAFKQIVSCHPYETIFDAPFHGYWKEIRQLRIELEDENGDVLWMTSFNPWQQKSLDRLAPVLVSAVPRQMGSRRYLTEVLLPPPEMVGRVWARYVCPGAPSEANMRDLIEQAHRSGQAEEASAQALVQSTHLPAPALLDIIAQAGGQRYPSLEAMFLGLHKPACPQEGNALARALRSVAVAGIKSAASTANFRASNAEAVCVIQAQAIKALVVSQPETLTDEQLVVIEGLRAALSSPKPLNGLLSGDVGTGKTLCFLIPAVAVQRAGGRVALVSPTEILADQIFANLRRRFPDVPAERVFAGGKIADPDAILVGTSGLGTVAKKAKYLPNFLVIDEQHKLSAKDRNAMVGPWTHQLEASATPIPRSLAASIFSGIQLFTLTRSPVARAITSAVIDEEDRTQVSGLMREALVAGHRIAVVYPRVEKAAAQAEGSEQRGATTVQDAAAALDGKFPGKVCALHGKMSSADIALSLERFRAGSKPLVVASTIMETGIDIPDIRLMIVKDAANFGVAQLHQLRGRLARNGGAARFVMMVPNLGALAEDTHTRLHTVAKIKDGITLAEADMATRGFGDLAGIAQTGGSASVLRLLKLELADFENAR